MSESKELDSQVLKACVNMEQHDKDVDDLIEEVNNLNNTFKDFKEELLEDLCNVIGLNVDKFAKDKYDEGQAKLATNDGEK